MRLLTCFALLSLLCTCASAPKIVKNDIEPAMINALRWQEDNPIQAKAPTDWTNGAYYTGVARAHQSTGNPLFLKAIADHGKRNDWNTYERVYHADDVAISYSYLYLEEQTPGVADLQPTADFLREHLYEDNRWKNGDKTKSKHILWWWCDALFMAPPVIAKHAKQTGKEAYLDELYTYYRETYDLLWNAEENLFARDMDYLWTGSPDDRKEANGEKIFWSRGNGWVLGGLALLLEELPADHQHRPFYLDLYRKMAAKIKDIQPADGMWRVSLLDPGAYNHGETSGTGFYTFALAWGINNNILDRKTYLPAVTKAWRGLRDVQQANGKIGWVQNIGKDPQPANADSWQNFGTGAFLLAGSEVMKLATD